MEFLFEVAVDLVEFGEQCTLHEGGEVLVDEGVVGGGGVGGWDALLVGI